MKLIIVVLIIALLTGGCEYRGQVPLNKMVTITFETGEKVSYMVNAFQLQDIYVTFSLKDGRTVSLRRKAISVIEEEELPE